MTAPLVSVIVPTYNRGARVALAIDSALGQTHQAIEVLVIDDGSTDDTSDQVAHRYASDPRVKLLTRPNGGPAAARNTGLAAARGEFIAFLDSDDEWLPWKIEFQLGCLHQRPGAGMVWTDMAAVDPDGAPVAARYLRKMYRRYAEIQMEKLFDHSSLVPAGIAPGSPSARVWHGRIFKAMLGGNLVHTSTVLLTADRAAAVGPFNETLRTTGEDYDYHLRTTCEGIVAFADVSTTVYRVGAPDQLTLPRHMAQMARNYIRTLENAIARGGVGEREGRRAIAGARGWLGEELLEAGEGSEARTHLVAALRGPRPFRALGLLLVARAPRFIARPLRLVLARIGRPLGRRAAG
jgi:GT2 family glycosyltransferase